MPVTRYRELEFKCLTCGNWKQNAREFTQRAKCPTCGDLGVLIFRPMEVRHRNKFHFRRADTYEEAKATAKHMEDSGRFHGHPELKHFVTSRVDQLKEMPEGARKIDYDNQGGHPVLDQD